MRGRLYCSRKPLSVPLVCTAPWARAACAQAASGPREAWPGLNRVYPSRFWPGHAQSGRCAWLRLAPLARGVALAYSQIKPYYWEIMPRPCHCRRVSALPKNRCFKPNGIPLHELEEVVLSLYGLEALRALQEAGIAVYYNANLPTVADCLNAFAAGRLVPFGPGHLCQGGCASER